MTKLVAAAGAALAVVAVLAVGATRSWWHGGTRATAPAKTLVATASLSATRLSFGDPLTARLDVTVDPARVDAASVRVRPRFSPYRIVTRERTERRSGAVLLSYRYELECLAPACVPQHNRTEHRFLPVLVSFRTPEGRAATRQVQWPAYLVTSRLTDAERAAPAQSLRSHVVVAAVSYRIDPGTLRAMLLALTVALVLAAAALVAVAFRRRRAPKAAPEPDGLSPLARALRRVRASIASGRPDERRKALGQLGRALRGLDRGELADDSARLAWSALEPTPEATNAFAGRVESTVGEA